MNIKRILTLLMVLCSLFAFLPSPGIAADNDKAPSIYFRPSVRFGTDDRTLYIMDFFVPLHRGNKDILFFEPRFTPNDQDGWETNLGIGYRHLLFDDKLILGGNVFYDTRRTGRGTYWDQVGFGFEAMTEFNKYVALTGRFNYYIPLTDPIVSGSEGSGSGYYFRDLGIYTSGGGLIEEAPEGFDAELGFRVPYVSDYVETWVYGGGYHYHGDYVGDVDGWSARLEVIPTDFLRLNYEYREDRTNQGEHHGEVALEVPFSIENLFSGKNPFAEFGTRIGGSRDITERMVESVHRDIDIRVIIEGSGDGSGSSGTEVAGVVFVSENAPNITGTPDGSFAHPFATVAAAVAAIESGGSYAGITTIHVMNDSTTDTISGGLVDLASLLIWGSGLPHPTYGYITNQYLGNPDIYDLNITSNNVEVFGANFVGTTGITTSGTGTNVHDNYFTATTGLAVTGGSSTVTNNTFLGNTYGIYASGGSPTITGNTIGIAANPITNTGIYLGSALTGSIVDNNTIVVNNSGTDTYGIASDAASLVLTNNDITVNSGSGTAYGILGGSSGGISGSISGGTITATGVNAEGIYLDESSGGSIGDSSNPFTISGVTINATATGGGYVFGIDLRAYNNLYAAITNSLITGTAENASAYGVYEYVGDGNLHGSITGGTITANGFTAEGIFLATGNGSIGDSTSPFIISGVTINATATGDSSATGIDLSAYDSLYMEITDNVITATAGNGYADGVYGYVTSGSIYGSITGGTITANGYATEGIFLYNPSGSIGDSTSPFIISGVTINATATSYVSAYGVDLSADSLYMEITNNVITVTDENENAFGIHGLGTNGIYGSITGGTITANGVGAYGVYLTTFGPIGGSSPFTISDAVINATATGSNSYACSTVALGSGDVYAEFDNDSITATAENGYAYGVWEYVNGNISGGISGGTITANGDMADGVYVVSVTGSIGDSTNPYIISDVTINATTTGDTAAIGVYASAYSGGIYTLLTNNNITTTVANGYAYGVEEYAYNTIYGGIYGGTITANGNTSVGVYLYSSSGSIGDSSNPFTISGVTADVTGGAVRYFMYLAGSGSGTSAITWTGNTYTPYGGSAVWSGNYDTTGFTTNGPLYLNGITDAEVTP